MNSDILAGLDARRRELLSLRLRKRDADSERQKLASIPAADRTRALPLSWSQQRLWFLHQLDTSAGAAYHMPLALRLEGKLDRTALRRALDGVVARHEVLRTRFVQPPGAAEPVQVIEPATRGWPLRERSVADLPPVAQEERLSRWSEEEAHAPFDLAQGPLVRGQLIGVSEQEHVLLLTQHHIVSDGWSIGTLVREVVALYAAALGGVADGLPPLPVQYADYAAWQRGWLRDGVLQAQLAYWTTALNGAPATLTLPTDRPRPPVQSYAGGQVSVRLEPGLSAAIRTLSRREGTTLFMTFLASWSALLSRLSGQEEVVVGVPVANRERAEIEPLLGFFVNTLAIRTALPAQATTQELLASVKQAMLQGHAHASLPFEQVVEALNPPRSLGHSPVFQTMLSMNNTPTTEARLPGLRLSGRPQVHLTTHFDLSLSIGEDGDQLVAQLEYASDLFDAATINRWLGYWVRLLEGMVRSPEKAVTTLPLISPEERRVVLEDLNATTVAYPMGLVHDLFEAQAALRPDSEALVDGTSSWNYGELNAQANRLAHRLIAMGVSPDDRVAICVDRGPSMVVAVLAVLKSGGAYVPLDPAYPPQRLAYMLADSAPVAVLSEQILEDRLPTTALPVLRLDQEATYAGMAPSNPRVPALTPRHLAYVIYTSGSTGQPKGVMVEHRNANNYLRYVKDRYALSPSDRVLQFSSLSFDAAFEELFAPLAHGGTCVLRPTTASAGMDGLRAACEQYNVTIVEMPTAYWHVAMADIASGRSAWPATVRLTVIGGEAASSAAGDTWRRHVGSRSILVNSYGPTEATIGSTAYHSSEDTTTDSAPSIGRPIANVRIYILDSHGEPVPVGVVGEIYIAGAGVARGYLNQSDLTAERFIPDPFGLPEDRLYRTGDLGRWLADGTIRYIGRRDFQVKIRGFRIELEEIETRLSEHPAVRETVVIAHEEVAGNQRLIAYIVLQPDVLIEASDLREHLTRQLPEYMLPTAFVQLDAIPLTPNGKLDRHALPAPGADALAHRVYEAPQGDREEAIARVWSELLGVERVGRHDNFFELGGHSLLAVRLIESLREAGQGISIKALFEQPTLASLAATLGSHSGLVTRPNQIRLDSTSITPEMLPLITLSQSDIDRIAGQVPGGVPNIQDIYALSPLQDGLLFHHLLSEAGDPYLLTSKMAFADRAVLDRFLGAVQQVVDRHDILRSAFVWEDVSEPAQVVWRRAPLSVTEIHLEDDAGTTSEQLAQRFDPRHTRIDLTQAPLVRFVVAREPDSTRWMLLCLQHHLIGDHSTMEILFNEVAAILSGRGDTLSVPQPFRNLVALTRQDRDVHEPFFRQMLADIDEPTLPFGLKDVHRDGQGIGEGHRRLPQALNDGLRLHARRLGVSLASLCHLAFGQVLARCSGREAVVFGTVLFGRMQGSEGADQAIGPFINTLPLRLDLDDTPVEQSVRQAHRRLAELLQHEHASLALAQRCSAINAPTPLFSALLNYRHNQRPHVTADATPTSAALDGITLGVERERTNYPFTVSVEDDGQSLGLTPQVVGSISPERVCDLMQCALEHLTQALDKTPAMPVRQLNVLPAAERELLLHTWNQTDTPFPRDLCIHQMFEAQVDKTPDAIALVQGDVQLTYAQLNVQANHLAHRLIAMGVQPDSRVAICVDRGTSMVVAMLATLKAGGAYVPLDPMYPSARLEYMLADCSPAAMLSEMALGNRLPRADGLPVVWLDHDASYTGLPSKDLQVPELTSSHMAYVTYTSGSTGLPKGVMVEHRSVIGLVNNTSYADLATRPRVLHASSPSFDAATFEIWGPLLNGGTCVVYPERVPTAAGIARIVAAHGVDTAFLTSGLFNVIVDEDVSALRGLRRILTGGEVLSVSHSKRARAALPGTAMTNIYGPTECTTFTSIYPIPQQADEALSPIPIGRPIANRRIYILDPRGEVVPIGVTGELHIGGSGVARGYLNRDELTAERFLDDPFCVTPGSRMYRSGDLARYLPDGNVQFLKRNDDQVKIRGFRIELGEIEARLNEHSAVREAAVMARGDEPGKRRVVAYVTLQPGVHIGATDLREHLARQLPDYMLPSTFVQLDVFPLTLSGKVDRKALPDLGEDASAHHAYEAPRGQSEELLAGIWSELLGVDRIGRNDHFFELGGQSLLAIRLVTRIQQRTRVELGLRDVFAHPVLADLADRLEHDEPYRNVVPIREAGNAPPVFLIHPAGGEIGYVRQMADELRPGYPIYGVAGSGLKEGQVIPRTIESMARTYLVEVRRIQPSGPYRLGGWSMGGTIAFEMAHQLVAAGEDIEFLGLLDTSYQPESPRTLQGETAVAYFALGVVPNDAPAEQRTAFTQLAKNNDLEAMYRYACQLKWIEDDVPMDAYMRHLNVRYAEGNAASEYTPRFGNFPLVHFCAAESSDLLFKRWEEEFPEKMLVIRVPGDHLSMMTKPYIRSLCDAFDKALSGAN